MAEEIFKKPTSIPKKQQKKQRNLTGTPDSEAQVVALSPNTLMATNRFLCQICGKGFQRDQNLQLHMRGHNLPWKLKQKAANVRKRVFVCPERTCVHSHPSRALGDLTGIKKHFCRKHGEKKWKCDKCCKLYAVQCDWKAHSKTCGTKAYKCECGTVFSRRDNFITHRAFCEVLAEETARIANTSANMQNHTNFYIDPNIASVFNYQNHQTAQGCSFWTDVQSSSINVPSLYSTYQNQSVHQTHSVNLSATALLQKASQFGPMETGLYGSTSVGLYHAGNHGELEKSTANGRKMQNVDNRQTRDFLGVWWRI